MRLRLPRRRIWRLTIYVTCVLLVLLALDLILANARRTIHPGYETTRIIAPLQDNGAIDYLAAVEQYFGRGITPENNAAPLLLQAFGRTALPSTQLPDGITARLGMAHLPEQGDYFIPLQTYAKSHAGTPKLDAVDLTRPETWPSTDTPFTASWLKANEKPLATIELATRRPRYFIPFDGGNRPQLMLSVLLPHVHLFTDAGLALLVRARLRLTTRDPQGCLSDLLATHRLARLLNQAPTLVERSVSMSIETAACRADQVIAASGKLSAPQAKALAHDLAAMPELDPPAQAVDTAERYMMLDFTQFCARANPTETGQLFHDATGRSDLPPPALFRFLPIPYERSMIVANQFYDGLLAAMRQPTYARRREAINLYEQDLQSQTRSIHLGVLSPDWELGIFIEALSHIQQRWEAARAQDRLSQVALALASFKADHGSYPATLSELTPEYLHEIPQDNFTDRPLIYTRSGTGYTLYSVGPNMTDDGGSDAAPADDIVATIK